MAAGRSWGSRIANGLGVAFPFVVVYLIGLFVLDWRTSALCAVLAGFGFLLVVKPELLENFLVRTGAPTAALFTSGALWPGVESTEFYKATAQIIPVLALALILDMGSAYKTTMDVLDRFTLVVAMGGLLLAGYVTLRVLAVDDVSAGSSKTVVAVLSHVMTFLVVNLLRRRSSQEDGRDAVPGRPG